MSNRIHSFLKGALLCSLLSAPFAPPALAGAPGTRITGEKSARAVIEKINRYDWDVQKHTIPNQVPIVISEGETVQVPFTIKVTRTGPETKSRQSPIAGQICLTNEGDVPTSGLRVRDQLEVEVEGEWARLGPNFLVEFGGNLAARETRCVDYSIPGITLNPRLRYRNHAFATIDNYAGREGMPTTIDVIKEVTIEVNERTIDETARLVDLFECPEGFSCRLSEPVDRVVTGSIEIPVLVIIKNDSVDCGQTLIFKNIARLYLAGPPPRTLQAEASVTLYTGSCDDGQGCVRTQGYWGSSPQGQALLASLVTTPMPLGIPTYTATQLDSILDTPSVGNALIILGHQLIAAKVNILNGASDDSVASSIALADSLIGSLGIPPVGSDVVEPSSELGQQMTSVSSILDQYNNGLLGVPSCDSRRGRP